MFLCCIDINDVFLTLHCSAFNFFCYTWVFIVAVFVNGLLKHFGKIIPAPPRPSRTHRQLTEEQRRHSLEEESVWLKLRSLTLRLLACSASLEHSSSQSNSDTATENGVGDKPSTLSSLLAQLQHTLQAAAQIAERRIQVRLANVHSIWNAVVFSFSEADREDLKKKKKKKSSGFVSALPLSYTFCSIHSWVHPPPAWQQHCPAGAVSARLPHCSCLSTCRSWRSQVSVRNDGPCSHMAPPVFLFLYLSRQVFNSSCLSSF